MPGRPRQLTACPRRYYRLAGWPAAYTRVVLRAEQLEDRSQPSATTLQPVSVLPDLAPAALDALVAPADPVGQAAPAVRHELVLIDFDVPERDALARSFLSVPGPDGRTSVEVVELTGGGIAELTSVLTRYHDLDAVRLISHGAAGGLHLGSDWLTSANLGDYGADLRAWGTALNPGADLLLYGCDVAATPAGQTLVSELHRLTGADVAASTDPTGSASLGGDWDLEYRTGSIEAAPAPPAASVWGHTLAAPSLFLVTAGDVSNGGVAGANSWTAGTVLGVGDPNFAVEPGTSGGTFSTLFDLNQFTSGDVNVDAMNYVRRAVTVGGGANTFALQPGDLLLSIDKDGKTLTSQNSLTVNKDDVFVFRPRAAGDYSAGTFYALLSNFKAVHGGNDTIAVSLVEADTQVGDTLLRQGTFLYTRDGASQDNQIAVFTPTGVGVGKTAGTTAVLIDGGKDLGMGPAVRGLDLVEAPTMVGSRTLTAGTLVLAVDSNATVGTNGLAVTPYDVFTLSVTKTTLVSGTATATAALLFQGSDAGLNGGSEKIAAVSLAVTGNGVLTTPPGLTVTGDTFLVAADNNVYRVNALTGAVVATYATGLANDGAVFGPDGTLYVADYSGNRVNRYGATGALLATFATTGTPQGLAFGPDGNLYVTTTNSTVERYTPAGASLGTFIAAGSGGLSNAKGIAWGPDGSAYVSSYGNSKVIRYDGTTGAFLGVFATGTGGFEDLTFGPDGNLYVASYGDGKVYRYRGTDGAALGAFTTGATAAYGVGFDPNGNLVVSSRSAGQLRLYNGTTGAYLGNLATGFTNPAYLSTTTSLVTTSAGGTATFRVALTSQPTANVVLTLTSSAPAQGTLTRTTLTFTPANWNTPQSVTVTGLDDGVANGDRAYQITGTVASGDANYDGLTFAPVPVRNREVVVPNRPPVRANDTYTTAEDTALTVPAATGVLANDTDPDGNPLTAAVASGPAHGTLVLAADGNFTYTPAANYNGSDSFTYTVSDGKGGTATGTVSLTVTAVNDPPTLNAIGDVTVAEDSGPRAVMLTGITAGGGESQGLQVTATSSNPAVVPNPTVSYVSPQTTGPLTFAPAANASGTATITVTVRDAGLDGLFGTADDGVTSRTFTVTVTPVNDPPAAHPDAYSTGLVPLNVALGGGVLANDTDPDGDPLTAVLVAGVSHGTLVLLANGSFVYTPALFFSGTDTFTYQAVDPSGARSAVTTVVIAVGSGNHAPAAAADAFTTAEDAQLTGATVLANDVDPDGDPLAAVLVSGPASGTLTLNPNGTFAYAPAADFTGTLTFTYQARDPFGALSGVATATITVTPVNDPPAAADDTATTPEDTAVTIPVLGNDSDIDGDPLTVVSVTQGAHGTVVIGVGGVIYAPNPDFNGTDSFVYTVSDGMGGLATGTVTVTVTPVNDAPTLDPVADVTANEDDGPQLVTLTGITAGGGESQTLTVTATSSNPALIPNPTVTYASAGTSGTLTFASVQDGYGSAVITVTVSDGVTATSRSFTVTVAPVNDPPAATDDTATTPEDTAVTIPVLGNDSDIDGDVLTVVGVTQPTHGTVTFTGTAVTYTPAANFNGTDSFTYTVSDGNGGTATATVFLTVTPVNDPPAAADDGYTTGKGTALSVPGPGVLANDTDVDGDSLTAQLLAGTSHGTLTLNADGSFSYTPFAAFAGTDSFTYQAVDPSGATSGPATVTVRVIPPNGVPVASDDAYTMAGGGVLAVTAGSGVLANDTPPGSSPLTASLFSGPSNGTLVLNADGSFTYTPNAGFAGTDSFNYKATDPQNGRSAAAHAVITVVRPNAAPTATPESFTTTADTPLVVTGLGVLADAADPDGDPLTAELVTGGSNGTVTMAADGSFSYTPDAGFTGTDSFTYRVTDGLLYSGTVTVTITVQPAASPSPPPVSPPPPASPPPSVSPPPVSPPPAPSDPEAPATPDAGTPPATDAPEPHTPAPGEPATRQPTAGPPPTGDTQPVTPGTATATAGNSGPGTASTTSDVVIESRPGTTSVASLTRPAADTGRVFASTAGDANPAPAPARPAEVPGTPAAPPSPVSLPPTPVALPTTPIAPPIVVPAPAAVTTLPAAPPVADLAPTDPLFSALDRVSEELRGEAQAEAAAEAVVATGVVASAGYVLLNTRAVFWFLSALLARPAMWRRFDPLDVIYAWEQEHPGSADADDDESLQSIVG